MFAHQECSSVGGNQRVGRGLTHRRPSGRFVLLALISTAAVAAQARAQSTVNVAVDATAAGTPLERVWPFFGYDEINYTTLPEGKALLKTLADSNTAPLYARAHFVLNTGNGTPSLKWGSTNAYTEDASGNPIYSWTIVDGIMDALTTAGGLPLVEIGFMPQALSIHPTPYQNTTVKALDGGCFYPPKDYNKWGALIRAWATHVKDRYPNAEKSWLWEMWNEPEYYWKGTSAEFAKLYDYTEAALHSVMPTASLGGPAGYNPAGAVLRDFLRHCATGVNAVSGAVGTRLDSVTFHAKGGVGITAGHVRMDLGNQLKLHQQGFDAVAAVAPFKLKPIYITEADPDGCAACTIADAAGDAYRNSPAYGAYEIAMMKRSLELSTRTGVNLGGLITWAFTFPNTPYFAGYRALTTNGINMPVLSAFKLLGSLAGRRMPVTSSGALSVDSILTGGVRGAQADVDAMATLNGDAVQVLVWNYHDDLVAVPATPVHLTVKVPASFGMRVTVSNLRVDEDHGDAYNVWVAQGRPAAPSATQLTALRAAMEPSPVGATQTLTVAAGAVTVDFSLPRFGVSLLTLRGESSAGDGGLDAMEAGREGGAADAPLDLPVPADGAIMGGSDANGDAAAPPPDGARMDASATVDGGEGDGARPGSDATIAPDAAAVSDAAAPDVNTPPVDGPSSGGDASASADRTPAPGPAASGCSCDTASGAAAPSAVSLTIAMLAAALLALARRRRGASGTRAAARR